MLPSNSTSQMSHKKNVSDRHSNKIFACLNRWGNNLVIKTIRDFCLSCTQRCAEAVFCLSVVGKSAQSAACGLYARNRVHFFCRSPYKPRSWKRRHNRWYRHILDIKITIRHESVPKYIPAHSQGIGPSPNTFNKKDWDASIILLYRELCPNLSWYVRHGAALANVGLWKRVQYTKYELALHRGRMFWVGWPF